MIGFDLGIENFTDASVIGEGGFATVYAATDRRLSRRVAVKVLRRNLTDSARRTFDRECGIMGRLSDHPNVVTVYSAGYSSHGNPYLVMELLDGGSLGLKLERSGPIPWLDAVGYMIPVVEALAAAHQLGVLHCDIKPENILLSGDEPRLTDFGIAQLQGDNDQKTAADEVNASWHHTAPETVDGKRDGRSDIYSVASTLYTLIVGQSPFWDPDDRALMSVVHRVLTSPVPKLDSGLGPAELDDFFARALAKDPDERPQTPEQLRAELQQLAGLGPRLPAPDRRPGFVRLVRSMQPIILVAAAVLLSAVVGSLNFFKDGQSGALANPDERGSLQSPYPVGQSVTVRYEDLDSSTEREWAIQLLEPAADLTEDAGVDPALPGTRTATARVRITNRRGTVASALSDLHLGVTSETGDHYASTVEACGSLEGLLDSDEELARSESIEGRLCWLVPADQLRSLVLAVEVEPADGIVYLALT